MAAVHVIAALLLAAGLAQGQSAGWVVEGDVATFTGSVGPGNSSRTPKTSFAIPTDTPLDSWPAFSVKLTAEGDLALFCSNADAQAPPTPTTAEYASDRIGTGSEVIYISPLAYSARKAAPPSDVLCSVYNNGPASGPAVPFKLTVQLVSNLSLSASESGAASMLYARCCAQSQCDAWEAMKVGGDSPLSYDLCNFHGCVCNDQGQLIQLDLAGYGLDCDFPTDIITDFAALQAIYLQNNSLSGDFEAITTGLAPLTQLEELVLSNNPIIDGWMSQAPESGVCLLAERLKLLEVSGDRVMGSVPACLFKDTSALLLLEASDNFLSGALPSFGTTKLQVLQLAKNNITGALPSSLAAQSGLQLLDLSQNQLDGSIPAAWPSSALDSVSLASNLLNGPVPAELAAHPSLRLLDLSDNRLQQFVAGQADTAGAAITHLSLAKNSLGEALPAGLLAYPSLVYLNMSAAGLQGALPEVGTADFAALRFLDLSRNSLPGSIPSSWGSIGVFKLAPTDPVQVDPNLFDLASSGLSGDLPAFLSIQSMDDLAWQVEVQLAGNSFANGCDPQFGNLAGVCTATSPTPSPSPEAPSPSPPSESPAPAPLSPSPSQSPAPSPPPTDTDSGSGLSGGAIAGIVISVLIGCAIVAGFVIYTKRKHLQSQASIFGGQTRFEKFEEDDFTRPPRDLELAGHSTSQQGGNNSGGQAGYSYH